MRQVSDRLQHSQYYILQSPHQSWLVTTPSNRKQPELEKNVIYAFKILILSKSWLPITFILKLGAMELNNVELS